LDALDDQRNVEADLASLAGVRRLGWEEELRDAQLDRAFPGR